MTAISDQYAAWPPDDDTVRCPFDYFKTLREEAPVYRFPETIEGTPVFVVTKWEDSADVLMRPDVFRSNLSGALPSFDTNHEPDVIENAPSFYEKTNVFFSDGTDHKAKRAWTQLLVTRDRMEQCRSIVAEQVNLQIDTFIHDGYFNVREQLTDVFPVRVVRELVGLPDAADAKIRRVAQAIEKADNNPDIDEELAQEVDSAWRDLLLLNADVLQERNARPVEGDYVSDLIALQKSRDGEMDVNGLARSLAATVFGADHALGGHLADVIGHLARNPELQTNVRKDRSLIRGLSNEALRMESSLPWLFRKAHESTEIAGVTIPQGSLVLVAVVSANQDSDHFPDPESFDVMRNNVQRDQLTMGRGVHRCVGAEVAKMQVETTVNAILDRMQDLRLVTERSDLLPVLSYGFRVPSAIHVSFKPI